MGLALCNTPAQTLFGLVPTLEGALSRSNNTVCLITFMLMVVLFDLK